MRRISIVFILVLMIFIFPVVSFAETDEHIYVSDVG